MMLETGMRAEEVAASRENVHLHRAISSIRWKDKGARCKVPLTEKAAGLLARHLEK